MTDSLIDLPVELIAPECNDRVRFTAAELAELATSIRLTGQAQPILVKPANPDGIHFLIAGERRWRAQLLNGSPTVQAIIRDVDGEAAADLMLAENEARMGLDPMEQAKAYQSRIDRFGWSVEDLAERMGKTPSYIRSRIALLKLCPELQHLVSTEGIWLSFAQSLTGLDTNRQRIGMHAWLHDTGMALSTWEALVARLRTEQAGEAQVGLLEEDWGLVAQEYVTTAKATRRPGRATLAKLLVDIHDADLALPAALAARVAHCATAWSGTAVRPDIVRRPRGAT